MTLYDVLRALVCGEAANLNSAKWVAEALAAIERHESAPVPASKPVPVPPRPSPEVTT